MDRDQVMDRLERLRREMAAVEARLVSPDGVCELRSVMEPDEGERPTVDPRWLGDFDHGSWEGPGGSVHLRRLPDGRCLMVLFDQRSTVGLARVRGLEFARWYASMALVEVS